MPDERQRHRYSCLQLVAPYVNGRLPAISEFKQVLCHDLSLSGFSYLSDVAPDCEQVIVALGKAPFILMAARVVHHSPTVIDGVRSEIVGCQFMARIEPGTASSAPTVVKYDFAASSLLIYPLTLARRLAGIVPVSGSRLSALYRESACLAQCRASEA